MGFRYENAASERGPAARAIDPGNAILMLCVVLLRQIEKLVELAEADARHFDENRADQHQRELGQQNVPCEPEAKPIVVSESSRFNFPLRALRPDLYGC